jgi:hypothetical protein
MTLDDFLDGVVDADVEIIEVSARRKMHGNEHGARDYTIVTLTTKMGVLELKRTAKGWKPL